MDDRLLKIAENRLLNLKDKLAEAAKNWPEIIPRDTVATLTGNLISSGHLANLDCHGEGPENSFRCGRRRCYFKADLINFLIKRLETV